MEASSLTLRSSEGWQEREICSEQQNGQKEHTDTAITVEGTMKDIQSVTKEVQTLVQNTGKKIDQFGPHIEKTIEATGTTLQGAQAT